MGFNWNYAGVTGDYDSGIVSVTSAISSLDIESHSFLNACSHLTESYNSRKTSC